MQSITARLVESEPRRPGKLPVLNPYLTVGFPIASNLS